MFWFFALKVCRIFTPSPGIKPAPPALESDVLTAGPPGKSQYYFLFDYQPHLPAKFLFQTSLLKISSILFSSVLENVARSTLW